MNYVTDVANLFLDRCPHITILSPTDFAIVAEWEKQGIPLPVILKSINEDCDENVSKVESISNFQPTVKSNFLTWLQTKAPSLPENSSE